MNTNLTDKFRGYHGGSSYSTDRYVRAANRDSDDPSRRDASLGFRHVRNIGSSSEDRSCRGGSNRSTDRGARAAFRSYGVLSERDVDFGFRPVRTIMIADKNYSCRGGGFYSPARHVRLALRDFDDLSKRGVNAGFRLARTVGAGRSRACRGGSYGCPNHSVRPADRYDLVPSQRHDFVGFRLVRTLERRTEVQNCKPVKNKNGLWSMQEVPMAQDCPEYIDTYISPVPPKPESMVLDEAKALVNGCKRTEYGPIGAHFRLTAQHWSDYLSAKLNMPVKVDPADVAMMMVYMKIGRHVTGELKKDNFIDVAGYAECAAKMLFSEE